MLPTPQNYSIYPAVVPADKPVQLTIAANEKAFLPVDGAEYELTVISVDGDESYYYEPVSHVQLKAVAAGGVIEFTHTFPGEQQHVLLLKSGDALVQEFALYSLYADLYALRPLKGDLHGHSCRSDGKRDPAALAGHYREQGYEFFALTDHNRFHPGSEADELYAGVQLGITRVRGEEVHAPGSVVHIVHVGGRGSVTAQYVHSREEYEGQIELYMARVPDSVPEAFKSRYAKAMWATDSIHAQGGLAIFPHPYWRPGKSMAHNVKDEYARLLLKSGMFDAYELIGGMKPDEITRSLALWGDLRAEGVHIPVVGSSDAHALEQSPNFAHKYTVCFAEENTNDAIIEAVRKGLSVAVEDTGCEYDRQARCYGSLRLVSYATFLLKNYYPTLQRICQGEGVAMRAYAMGQADKALVEIQVAQSDAFRRRFFGLSPAEKPEAKLRAFEACCRETEEKLGPGTRGSAVKPLK